MAVMAVLIKDIKLIGHSFVYKSQLTLADTDHARYNMTLDHCNS